MHGSEFIEMLTSFREGFATMAGSHQALAFVGLIALTVLALSLVYYIVKGTLYLTYYVVKGSLYLAYYSIKLPLMVIYYIFKGIVSIIIPPRREYQPTPITAKITSSPMQQTVHYCPDCGKPFTPVMEGIFQKTHQCFCEACGAKAEILS